MSAGKHTPGPWEVNANSDACPEEKLSVETGYGYFICAVDHSQDQQANARLIAAAPELLRALEMMILFNKPMKGNAVALNAAYQAIAKATGTAG